MEEISLEKTTGSNYIKGYISLLLIFILVMSDPFIDNVLSCFGENAVKSNKVSAWGTILQGMLMIFFYIIAQYMIEQNII
jgi:uncharacterized membrane protein HdeD (DUF308 family)